MEEMLSQSELSGASDVITAPANRGRPWTADDRRWLRALKEPDVPLRPCDWRFLTETLGRTRTAIGVQVSKMGLGRRCGPYDVNEQFFDEWNAPMAWVLGNLLSDGHLRANEPTIRWNSTDRALVERIRACLASTHPIYERRPDRHRPTAKTVYVLTINRQRLRAGVDAAIAEARQRERRSVPEVPSHLLAHFVRGYFEGNGSISFSEGQNQLHLHITGNSDFVEGLRARLHAAGLEVPPNAYRNLRSKDSATLQVVSRRAFRLADFLYRDAPAYQCVERKRAVYLSCLAWRRARGLESLDAV